MWLRENGTPYYIGKGMGGRAFRKRRLGKAPDRERIIVQEYLSETDAFIAEKFLISLFGREDLRTGCLLNRTDGGDAPPSAKGKKRSLEFCRKLGLSRKGIFKHSQETRRKMSISKRGIAPPWLSGPKTEQQKRRISKTLKDKGIGFAAGYTPWNKGIKWSSSQKGKPWSDARRAACKA